jgi:hypothetical protein
VWQLEEFMKVRTAKFLRRSAVVFGAGLVLMQFVPVDRSNPHASSGPVAPPETEKILRTSCFDCHSNETKWPWYSRVAPASWLVARDVNEGREHLNFSEWNRLPPADRAEHAEEIAETVTENEMPLWFYVPLHRDAALTTAERATLMSWARQHGAEGSPHK